MALPRLLFPDASQAIISNAVVRACHGVELELKTETLWLVPGNSFVDNVGRRWTGLGTLGDISGVQVGPEAATGKIELTLSGLDAAAARNARDSNNQIRGGTCRVYLHLFDEQFRPIDRPYLLATYELDNAELQFDGKSRTETIRIRGNGLFLARSLAPLSLVSNADQQARFPGDRAFERMSWRHTVKTKA